MRALVATSYSHDVYHSQILVNSFGQDLPSLISRQWKSIETMPTATIIIGRSYREKGGDHDEVETPRTPRHQHQGSEKGGYVKDRDRDTVNLKS